MIQIPFWLLSCTGRFKYKEVTILPQGLGDCYLALSSSGNVVFIYPFCRKMEIFAKFYLMTPGNGEMVLQNLSMGWYSATRSLLALKDKLRRTFKELKEPECQDFKIYYIGEKSLPTALVRLDQSALV